MTYVRPTETLERLYARDSLLSSLLSLLSSLSSSLRCKGHSDSGDCQMPLTSDALTIALAVCIPVVVILLVLGFFLYKAYRRDRKELMEHDPDFDENGEATALPDLPRNHFENPFHNRNSVRYPDTVDSMYQKSASTQRLNAPSDTELGPIVLPFQHHLGSKASLDDYAKYFGESQGYRTSPLGSARGSFAESRTPAGLRNVSPQKSNLRTQIGVDTAPATTNTSPVKRGQYVNVAQESTSDLESVENSEEDDSYGPLNSEKHLKLNHASPFDDSTTTSGSMEEKFQEALDLVNTTTYVDRAAHNDRQNQAFSKEHEAAVPAPPPQRPKETPQDDTENAQRDIQWRNEDKNMQTYTHPEERKPSQLTNARFDDSEIEGDFNFSRDASEIKDSSDIKHDSDDEDDGSHVQMTEEQKEQLQRMKSVYKVYFDNEKNDKVRRDNQPTEFVADPRQPLPDLLQITQPQGERQEVYPEPQEYARHEYTSQEPQVYTPQDANYAPQELYPEPQEYSSGYPAPEMYLEGYQQGRVNEYQGMQSELPVQYSHNDPRRMTTASSVYTDSPMNTYEQVPHRQHRPELPPLRTLPNASDIRNSTLQTYTDYVPRAKMVSPTTNRIPADPLSGWGSGSQLPLPQSQSQFSVVLQNPNTTMSSTNSNPSATQLSRSSVTMINPVAEFTKQRKFKPAGSPTILGQPMFGHLMSETDSDLIPGNRKSDVRRMMNTNF